MCSCFVCLINTKQHANAFQSLFFYLQTDLYGQNITQITHPDDHNILKKELMPKDLDTLFDIQPDDDSGEPRPRTADEEAEIDKRLREDRRTFTIRLVSFSVFLI